MSTSRNSFLSETTCSKLMLPTLVASLFLGAAIIPIGMVRAQTVRLEWSMAPRLEQSWEAWNADQFTYDPDYIYPQPPQGQGWRVTFDLCSSSGGGSPIEEYSLFVQGMAFEYSIGSSRACRISTRVPRLGKYEIKVRVETRNGRSASHTEVIEIKDWLIAIIGDSMFSGEGNPDQPGDPAVWKDHRCHRSARSGPALAAQQLEARDPHSSVTLIDLACSGAEIFRGLLGPYEGMEPPEGDDSTLPPQVEKLENLAGKNSERGGRRIDALLLSVGMNDLGFSDIIRGCAKDLNELGTDATCITESGVDDSLEVLPDKYARLDDRLENLRISEVYIAEYPVNAVHGGGCGILDVPVPDVSISPLEADRLTTKGKQLNQIIQKAAELHEWNYVGGMTEAFRGHSYCDETTYFIGWSESEQKQSNRDGTLHPNSLGHAALKELLLDAIVLRPQFPHERVTITFTQVKVGTELREGKDLEDIDLDLPPGIEKGLGKGHFPEDFSGGPSRLDPNPHNPRPRSKSDELVPAVRLYVSDYQNEPLFDARIFRVQTFGKYVDLPTDKFTYTLDIYPAPASPRHPIAVGLMILSNGAQLNGHHGRANNYGEGAHELVHQTGKVSVKYTIRVEDLPAPVEDPPFGDPPSPVGGR